MMKALHAICFIFLLSSISYSQNTVGVLKNDAASYNGYTLFSPLFSNNTYLINNCGEIINQWDTGSRPSASVYLLENGNLLTTGRVDNDVINLAGVGGKIALYNWDGQLLWEYVYSDDTKSQHHDVYPLPNGNFLMLAATVMTEAEAIQAGRNPALLVDGMLFNEQILELEPIGKTEANIVWEWNINDHLIQDFDATKDNFGNVSENPQLLDINYEIVANGGANWLHVNSIQYNEELDQIVFSSRNLSEIFIIDHSTSTKEAELHTGGTYGMGGDFLFRWGNPESYDNGDSNDRTLFSQHYPHWIPEGLIDEGKLMIFNNGVTFSSLDIISPTTTAPGIYAYDNGFGPSSAEWSYTDPVDPTLFYSSILSGGQRLPNGNTLICSGFTGNFFEITPDNEIVWEYINPDTALGILNQTETPSLNAVFRAMRYPTDYAAFDGKDLTPGDPVELNFNIDFCSILAVEDYTVSQFEIYPNPTSDFITVNSENTVDYVDVYTIMGTRLDRVYSNRIDMRAYASGVYYLKITAGQSSITKKLIKN